MGEKETLLSRESAETQFRLILDYYDLDDFENDPDDKTRKANVTLKNKIVKAIQSGYVEIEQKDDTLLVHQTLRKPVSGLNQITYKEVTGNSKIGMKDRQDSDHFGKLYAFLSGLSGYEQKVFLSMKGKDLSTAEAIGLVFLEV